MLFKNINILCPNGEILQNAYLSVRGKFINYVGKDFPEGFSDKIYNGKNKLIIPGFVNAHSHVPMTLLRSAGSGLALKEWLNNKIFPMEAKLTDRQCYSGSILGIAEMIKSGITSFTDMYLFGEACCMAVLDSGIKANISMGVTCFDDTAFDALPFVKETKYMLNQYHNMDVGRLKIDAGIHGEYTSNATIVKKMGEFAASNGINTHIHLCETIEETNACIQRHGKTPVEYFDSLGFFDNPTTAAHCVHLTDNDMDILAAKNVTVAHCPISNLKLGSGVARIVNMQNKGINIAIGTDGVASNDNLNFFEDIKFAALLQKGIHQNSTLLTAKEVLGMSQLNGAISQGRKNTGVLKEGYLADLAVIDLGAINLTPTADLISTIVYAAMPQNVCLTMVDGRVLYKDGEFLTIDIEKTLHEVRDAAKVLNQ